MTRKLLRDDRAALDGSNLVGVVGLGVLFGLGWIAMLRGSTMVLDFWVDYLPGLLSGVVWTLVGAVLVIAAIGGALRRFGTTN